MPRAKRRCGLHPQCGKWPRPWTRRNISRDGLRHCASDSRVGALRDEVCCGEAVEAGAGASLDASRLPCSLLAALSGRAPHIALDDISASLPAHPMLPYRQFEKAISC